MNDEIEVKQAEVAAVDEVIQRRKTVKHLCEGLPPILLSAAEIQTFDDGVKAAIQTAGWAPFHYDRKQDGVAEPWRFSLFFHQRCRQVSSDFNQLFEEIKPNNKLPRMLAACGALVLVNWIPERSDQHEKLEQINEEHLAATAAATQNLLLALEARGFGTYWSSGGQLGSTEFFRHVEIPICEKLIGAIFVNYPGLYPADQVQMIPGKLRPKRSDWSEWTRVIE